eukprot:scaffold148739_cov18-Tisochrysis_lutea.AAC.2
MPDAYACSLCWLPVLAAEIAKTPDAYACSLCWLPMLAAGIVNPIARLAAPLFGKERKYLHSCTCLRGQLS